MAVLAEVVDVVIGADTHRDTNQLEIAYPSGAVIATRSFGNDSTEVVSLSWVMVSGAGPAVARRRAR